MIPILYKSDEVDFYDNGLGPLNDIYDVDVQEQRNGLFTLTASYPVSGRRYKDIEVGRIVLAKPNQNDKAQAFRIIHTELDISGYALTIEADHITYDLTHNLVKSVHLQGNGQNAMTHLQEATVAPHLFRFISDLQHEGDSTLTMVNPMEAIAGTQGSILQIWGGELKRDNRTVSMLSRRGRNNFTSFRLGKNINGLKYTVDTANLVTRIVPSVQRPNGNENELIIGDIVDSKNVGNYPNYYMQHVDVADKIKIDENDSDDVIKGKINAYAKNWFTQSANSKIDLPEVTVEIDVTSLQDSADYQDKFKNLEAIELTDSVTVYVPEFGVNVQAVVNELHYDTVAERVTSIVIGTSKLSFADANSNTLKELGSSINKIRENAVTAIVSANGKNTNYHGTEEPAHPVEGDLWFKSVGDETYLMIFKDGRWQEWVSTKTQDIINKQVDDALASAKEYTDELNEKQAKDVADFKELVDTSLADAKKDRDELSQKADDMLTTANKYSDDIYSKAVANAKEQASSTLTSANQALAEAKKSLGNDISKAQSDITATQKELSGKVSQSDFDTKTGDLTTKYAQVKTTADSVTTDVANYKKSNDSKVSANTANITANAKAIALRVSQTDFDFNSKDVNTKISNQQITVDKISQSVTELQAKANTQGQVNQLMNTEFTPDMQGWDMSETWAGTLKPYRQYIFQGSNMLTFDTRNQTDKKYSSIKQTIPFATSGRNRVVSVSWWSRIEQGTDLYGSTHIRSYDASMTKLTDVAKNWDSSSSMTLQKFENISIPDEARFVEVTFAIREGYLAFLAKPMFVYQSTVGDYVQGNYNNNARVTALELDIDGIHGLVDDPSKGLSATWNLASDGQSIAVQAKTAASTADGKAVAAQKDATTAITTANGTQTTVTDVQKDVKDLQSTTTQTAGQVTTEIEDRKNGDSSVRTDLSSLIDQRVKETKSGYESYFSQQAQGIIAGVSMPNQLINTEFTPDLQGWSGNNFISYAAVNKSTKKMGSNVLNIWHSVDTGWGQYSQQITNFMVGGSVSASVYAREDSGEWTFTLDSYDATGKRTILRSVSVSTGYSLLKIENVEIPQDAVELRYSFWSQTVGMLLIAQPMLVFSDSVPIYMPGSYSGINTSTVLELFKDNWALGIADNSGKIISGINGDTSGTVIQGKMLVINSDTTINGKAFIDGSVIKNASIGTAQIGKAAIGSAQIIDVDVSKISGNIANFITANVNTLNARVLYGDTGHLGTTDTGLIINKQDDHLQLSSKGQYDVDTKRAQLELLNYADNIDANMQGSLNYYKNPHNNGTGLGIRLLGNQILAIDEAVSTGNLYLSPYASGQVQVVNRDRNGFQDIKASKFVTSSERKYKSEINEFNDDALDLVNGLNIRSYIKNSENEIGVIADEADERILDKTNTGVDLYSFVSVVAKAVQELSAQVKELKSERPNN